ncbi:effector-binding domain-containing protein [Salegentibacter sp. 24]|uniref:GyrI-like domain-containing protein n=1 Tax=Salegentibacter sp. 24 TaxID=2183986 RepID=UPI001061A7AE|nr:GyrI-like domain-containing protein [Salegentibacter sp. 24]TDN83049.1 effector-binding domain-containing protein [Salegentibacter sp. 24]
MSKKNWLIFLTGVPILFLLWYFPIKKYDYTITFETKALPGEIAYRLDSPIFEKMEAYDTKINSNFSNIIQQVKLRKETYDLQWHISPKNDSVNTVEVGIINTKNSFNDRLLLLLGQNDLQKEMKNEIQFFKEALSASLKLYTVKIEEKAVSPASTCACISATGKTDEKAFEMMRTIDILTNFILDHKLKTKGRPRILIESWNKITKKIDFKFCFPIAKRKNYPTNMLIDIKEISSKKSLKASFYGNYMFSHYAWFHLLDYAEKNNIKVEAGNILEVFQTNPQLGTDPQQWKAEIYLPLLE